MVFLFLRLSKNNALTAENRAAGERERARPLAHLAAKPFGFHCRLTKWCGCGNTSMPSSATGSGIAVFSQYNDPPKESLENQGFSGEAAF